MLKTAGLSGIILLFGSVLNASPVTYSYTGDAFTDFSGSYSSAAETNITVSVTFASALGANVTEIPVSPLSFQITDGATTLTDQSADIDNAGTLFEFGTDGAGDIDAWIIEVTQTNGSGYLELASNGPYHDFSSDCDAGSIPGETCNVVSQASVTYASGGGALPVPAFELVTAPEPSTAGLVVMAGLCALLGRGLRARFAHRS
jgi:hypothetical protein